MYNKYDMFFFSRLRRLPNKLILFIFYDTKFCIVNLGNCDKQVNFFANGRPSQVGNIIHK
jgi:hypothetical protein